MWSERYQESVKSGRMYKMATIVLIVSGGKQVGMVCELACKDEMGVIKEEWV